MGKAAHETDVVIIGGGPAGLAAAIAARRKGLRVLVADHARPPIDKACGEGLLPDGVAALARLGVTPELNQAIPFRGIRFIDGEASAEASFPNGCGLGIPRTTLHEILIRRANEEGVSVCWGAQVSGLAPDGVEVNGDIIRCRWVIGADGQNSVVRRWVGLSDVRVEKIRFGVRRRYDLIPWTDLVEVYWGDGCQVVITPVGPREVCAALISRNPRLRFEDVPPLLPALKKLLTEAIPTSKNRGAASALRMLKSVAGDRFALVGDASGSVDPITGEGLCLAFKQAVCLAEAIANGKLSQYAADHRRITRVPVMMCNLMLAMDHHAALRRRVMRAFASRPRTFSRLLETHVGAASPAALGIRGAFELGWQMLAG